MKTLIEFWQFARENKKWWLFPLFLMLFLISVLFYFGSGTIAAPFVYSVF